MAVIGNCKSAEAYLAPFLDEALAEEETLAVQEHLLTCPDCAARLALARQALILLHRLRDEEDVTLPEGFQARLMQRVLTGDLAVDALDFSWQGLLATLIALLEAIFDMLAGPQPAPLGQPVWHPVPPAVGTTSRRRRAWICRSSWTPYWKSIATSFVPYRGS